ncbi:diacylglycerol kinase 4-like isoform X2 [Apium graveolens]|uniref:diacylglycerol kinase 4-like isoform X2 n=1 Tax=Apium graveolens TaxID=4045 RepID=UPI003D7904F0
MDNSTRLRDQLNLGIRMESIMSNWIGIPKDELKKKIIMPTYIRLAMYQAMESKDIDAPNYRFESSEESPESPLVVFINSRSGGRQGPELKEILQNLMSEEQYGLGCLEKFAGLGDQCAIDIREKLRVVAAGGDGTVGWLLGCLGELSKQGREPVPPTSIIPLGTGNDLSRSFGWGGSLTFKWKSAVKRSLYRATNGPICRLDSWKLRILMPAGEELETPHALKPTEEFLLDQDLEIGGELAEKVSCYEGVFYNYCSIGMDAQVAYGFHNLRNEKPFLAQGPIANKIIYSGYSCKQGWFLTPCIADPSLRGLNNILRMHIKTLNCSDWKQVPLPSSIRALVALNLQNYASGRNPWGNLKPDYMEKKGFVEPHVDDGLLEVFGLKQGWHASFVMGELIQAKHIAQASEIRFEFRGGQWKECFMQMDGEPWKLPMSMDYSSFVEIRRVPFQSVMINGEQI